MSSASTPNLLMNLIAGGQAEAYKVVNAALTLLDSLVGGAVLSRTLNSPSSAVNGDRYLVGPSPTGVWADFDPGDLVAYNTNAWVKIVPVEGWVLWLADEKVTIRFDGSAWNTHVGECIFSSRSAAGIAVIDGSAKFIPWDTDELVGGTPTTSSVFTHSEVTNNDEITLAENGNYLVTVQTTFNATAGAAAGRCELSLYLAGADVAGTVSYGVVNSSTITHCTVTTTYLIVTSGAAVILKVKVTRGAGSGTINIPANTSRITVTRK